MGSVPRDEILVPQPVRALDLAYFAGIVDGEGHLLLSKGSKGIVLCMADIPILEWCRDRFGGRLSSEWVNERNQNRRPRRIWNFTRSPDLVFLLPKLLPYLVLKADEAELVLEAARMSLEPGPNNTRNDEWKARRAALVPRHRAAVIARKPTAV